MMPFCKCVVWILTRLKRFYPKKLTSVSFSSCGQSTEKVFSNATELADYLASKGMPFRQAHEIVGKLVLECSKVGYYLQDVPLERYQEISDLIELDIYTALQSKIAVHRVNRLTGQFLHNFICECNKQMSNY